MTYRYSSELHRKAIHHNTDSNQLLLKTQGLCSNHALKSHLPTPLPLLLNLERLSRQPLNLPESIPFSSFRPGDQGHQAFVQRLNNGLMQKSEKPEVQHELL